MEIFDAVRTLLAVRSFQDRPVPDSVVRRILEAGQLTGSARNKQPWHFGIVEGREELRELAANVPTGPYIAGAALAIVVVADKTPYAISDVSRAVQSMVLTAWGEGVGSNWAGFLKLEKVNELLGIPGEFDVLAVLPLGYPTEEFGKGEKARKPLSEIVFRGRWGVPFE